MGEIFHRLFHNILNDCLDVEECVNDAVKQEVTVNGSSEEVFISPSEEETNTIVWSDNSIPVMFSFTAEYDVETLIKVAENVKFIEEEELE